MGEGKQGMTREEVRALIERNLPAIREVAPKEYDTMLENGEVLAERLTTYMRGVLKGQGVEAERQEAAPVAVEVGAIVVAIVAGEVAGQRAGGHVVMPPELAEKMKQMEKKHGK